MKKALTLLGLAAMGCATLTAPPELLTVHAQPEGASVHVNGVDLGRAPVTATVPRNREPTVEVAAPGFETKTCPTQMSAGGGYIAADVALCVLLFPIGCISFIDAGGAWNQLAQPQCNVTLQPQAAPSASR